MSAISLAAITIAFSSEVIAACSAVPNKPLVFWTASSLNLVFKIASSIKADSAATRKEIPFSAFLAAMVALLDCVLIESPTEAPAGSLPWRVLSPVDNLDIAPVMLLLALKAESIALWAPIEKLENVVILFLH